MYSLRFFPTVPLQTDDCGVFETSLTEEFEKAQEAFNLSQEDFKKICTLSINHAFCSDQEKDRLSKKVNEFFNENELKWENVTRVTKSENN